MADSKKLSIAHVSLARGYKGNERQTELLIKELANLGVPQMLICRDDSPLPFHLDGVKGLKIMRISGVTDPRFIGHFRLSKRCAILQAHETHAVHWCFVHYLLFGIPFVVTRRSATNVKENFFNRTIYHSAAHIVAISKVIAEQLEKQFDRKIDVIGDCSSHMQPDYKTVKSFKEALKNRFVVGNVGALINRQKGQSVLIDAARILKNKIPELVVIFVGAGDDLTLLKQHADGLPNIKFVGFKRNVVDYIASFDVFAYPANSEGVGSILLDVMEQGVPLIASNVGTIPDLVKDGQSGLLVNPGDAEALATCILQLKKNATLRQNLIAGGQETAEQHSSAAMAADYYRLYIGILNNDN